HDDPWDDDPWPDDPQPDDGGAGFDLGGGPRPGGGGGPVPPSPRGGGAGPAGADSESASTCAESDMDSRPVDAADPLDDTDLDDPAPSAMVAARAGGLIGRSGGLRLLARLATVAGADARPGILAGWGPVHAELARTIATTPGARWWYVLVEHDGSPAAIGRLRTRPNLTTVTSDADADTVCGLPRRGRRQLHVWLQVTKETLDELAAQPPPGWQPVLDEITTALATNPGGPPNTNPTARLPGAALRRWLHVRDHTCVFPTCGVPAHRSDADHTTEHANGGPTTDANLASACRPHHRLREVGWSVKQPKPGHVAWTSPSGHTYTRQPPESLDQLPDPMPHPPSATETNNDDYLPSELDWR